jgi:hypothetical protein
MNAYVDLLWEKINYICFLLPLLLVAVETIFISKIISGIRFLILPLFRIRVSKYIITGILLLSMGSYIVEYGFHFMQLFSQKILLLRVYSFELSNFLQITFQITAVIILSYLIYSLINDIVYKSKYPWSFILIMYLGILSMYVNGSSIRYSLIPVMLVFLYLAFKLVRENKSLSKVLIICLIVNILILQFTLWNISSNEERELKAYHFRNGKEIETSAHFLPFSPVLDFVHEHQIGNIETKKEAKEKYFIETPFRFYKVLDPSINSYQNSMWIEYDYQTENGGFTMKKLPPTGIQE